MKILIKPRKWIEHNLSEDGGFCERFNFISIFSSKDLSPLPEQKNILKLEIDDITDGDIPQFHSDGSPLILFNGEHAEKVISFIHNIDWQKTLVVHCDAGISRSGAVGLQLNKYCNSIFEHHPRDYESFFLTTTRISCQIQQSLMFWRKKSGIYQMLNAIAMRRKINVVDSNDVRFRFILRLLRIEQKEMKQ